MRLRADQTQLCQVRDDLRIDAGLDPQDSKQPRESDMMTLLPKASVDMMLAPVAAEIDINLQRLRDKSPGEVDATLQLELDRETWPDTPDERADHVLQAACRNVDLHGWQAAITEDGSRLRLSGGSVSIDLGLGRALTAFIDGAR